MDIEVDNGAIIRVVANAPERRVFYIDLGNSSQHKEEYVDWMKWFHHILIDVFGFIGL